MKNLLKIFLPEFIKIHYRNNLLNKQKKFTRSLPIINEKTFLTILKDELNIISGDTIFIHSSLDRLNLEFPPNITLQLLIDLIGEKGNIIFPTYPKLTSYLFLKTNQIFNIRNTPSYMGILSEFARKNQKSIRSLHPTKSVVAIGPDAKFLTSSHQNSPYPYDFCSPYYKIRNLNSKIIGIGVSTDNLSCIHCAEDYLKEDFPVNPYFKKMFNAVCIDYNNNIVTVPTFAHNMIKLDINIPKFVRKFIPKAVCEDLNINSSMYFRADAKEFIDKIIELGREKFTVYSKIFYKW